MASDDRNDDLRRARRELSRASEARWVAEAMLIRAVTAEKVAKGAVTALEADIDDRCSAPDAIGTGKGEEAGDGA